jgi:hypothetical protein
MRASGLSPASLDSLLTIVNETRKVQNLPEAGHQRSGTDAGADGETTAT